MPEKQVHRTQEEADGFTLQKRDLAAPETNSNSAPQYTHRIEPL